MRCHSPEDCLWVRASGRKHTLQLSFVERNKNKNTDVKHRLVLVRFNLVFVPVPDLDEVAVKAHVELGNE